MDAHEWSAFIARCVAPLKQGQPRRELHIEIHGPHGVNDFLIQIQPKPETPVGSEFYISTPGIPGHASLHSSGQIHWHHAPGEHTVLARSDDYPDAPPATALEEANDALGRLHQRYLLKDWLAQAQADGDRLVVRPRRQMPRERDKALQNPPTARSCAIVRGPRGLGILFAHEIRGRPVWASFLSLSGPDSALSPVKKRNFVERTIARMVERLGQ